MVEVCVATDKRKKRELLQTLAEGREKCLKNAALLGKAKSALEARREPINAEAYRAIASMQFKRWIFLKDTKAYSVFLDPTGEAAYAVLGLTDRIQTSLVIQVRSLKLRWSDIAVVLYATVLFPVCCGSVRTTGGSTPLCSRD